MDYIKLILINNSLECLTKLIGNIEEIELLGLTDNTEIEMYDILYNNLSNAMDNMTKIKQFTFQCNSTSKS